MQFQKSSLLEQGRSIARTCMGLTPCYNARPLGLTDIEMVIWSYHTFDHTCLSLEARGNPHLTGHRFVSFKCSRG